MADIDQEQLSSRQTNIVTTQEPIKPFPSNLHQLFSVL